MPVQTAAAVPAPYRSVLKSPLLLPLGIIIALFAAGAAISPNFASMQNIWSLLAVASLLAIASAAQMIVIVSGNQGIDLSVGPVMTLGALIAAGMCQSSDGNIPLAVVAVAIVSIVIGAVNFIGVSIVGIYPLVMTLGMAFVLQGGAFVYAQDHGPAMPPHLLLAIGADKLGPVPWLVIFAAITGLALTALLRWSRFGRQLYLVGANPRAARSAGVPVTRVYLVSYGLAALLSGFAGILLFGFAGSANLSIGTPYTLMSIAAAVIGGTALTGGQGSVLGAYLGSIVFTVLSNLLIVIGMDTAARQVLSGIVLIAILAVTAREKAARI